MQRAAIARALVHEPALLVADEPTGNLDSENGANVLALLAELNRELAITILLATHAHEVAAAAGRVIRMRDGRLADDSAVPHPHRLSPCCRVCLGSSSCAAWRRSERGRSRRSWASRSASRSSSRFSSPTPARCAGSRPRSTRSPAAPPLEIVGTGGVAETRIAELGWLREFGALSPVIEGEMAIVSDGRWHAAPSGRRPACRCAR